MRRAISACRPRSTSGRRACTPSARRSPPSTWSAPLAAQRPEEFVGAPGERRDELADLGQTRSQLGVADLDWEHRVLKGRDDLIGGPQGVGRMRDRILGGGRAALRWLVHGGSGQLVPGGEGGQLSLGPAV